MSDEKKPRVFVTDGDGDSWLIGTMPIQPTRDTPLDQVGDYYKARESLAKTVGEFVLCQIDASMGGANSVEVKVEGMTDAEVEAMPED